MSNFVIAMSLYVAFTYTVGVVIGYKMGRLDKELE